MQKQSLNRGWRFHMDDWENSRWREPDDSTWRAVDLPHDWSIELPRDPANPSGTSGAYFPNGRAWYRQTIDAPEAWRGRKVYVEFEGAYMSAEVWLGHDFLGRHPYGYTSFYYDLTPYLRLGEANVLRVLVDNEAQPNSRWYSGSGLYRPAWLLVADPVHVRPWGIAITTPVVSAERATVSVRIAVQNESDAGREVTVRTKIVAPDGSIVGSTESSASVDAGSEREVSQQLEVAQPQRWSPDTPHLYRLLTEVVVGGRVVDSESTTFGIRSVQISAEQGFLLNGQPLLLKGGCVHHDNGVLGAAAYARSEERKVELHKASGYNAIRCAHNPPSPAFLDACDRLGMLVIDEAFDCWRDGKNPYDYHVAFDDWWQRDLESMVHRDRNHPSVILWSIGNELIERGRPQGPQLARRLADYVRALDPSRGVTAALCGSWEDKWDWPRTGSFFAALDVGGYNYKWQEYRSDHEQYPQRVMAGTESFPKDAYENWASVVELPYVIGDFVWTSLDYLGESGIGRVYFDGSGEFSLGKYPWHQANCGDLDLCGWKRPQSYYRDQLWGVGDKLYIAVHDPVPEGKTPIVTRWGWPEVWPNWTWPGREGQSFQVDAYSACERVELFLNGRSLGSRPAGWANRCLATWQVPYEAGELRAVGYGGDQKVAEWSLSTVGQPVVIRLTPDRAVIRAEGGDLSFVTVELIDAAGRVHPSADATLFFTVQGAGAIAAVGNSNPVSTESYIGHERSSYRGRCLVVVKPAGTPGEIRLRAQGDGLDSAEIVLSVA